MNTGLYFCKLEERNGCSFALGSEKRMFKGLSKKVAFWGFRNIVKAVISITFKRSTEGARW